MRSVSKNWVRSSFPEIVAYYPKCGGVGSSGIGGFGEAFSDYFTVISLSPLSDGSGFVGITSLTPYTGSSSSTASDLGMRVENMWVIVTIDSEVVFEGKTITKL